MLTMNENGIQFWKRVPMSKEERKESFPRTSSREKYGVRFDHDLPPKVEQQHKELTSMRSILDRANRGALTLGTKNKPGFCDFTGSDYTRSKNIVADAKSAFEKLPSNLRERFHNNPGEFMDYVADPNNRDDMIENNIDVSHLPVPEPDSTTLSGGSDIQVTPDQSVSGQSSPE